MALCTFTLGANASSLDLTTDQGVRLKADYFQSVKDSERGVLMLHQCNYNRSMYDKIGEQLAQKGIHALSLDFRGYGESVSDEFDMEKIRALSHEKRGDARQAMTAYWPKDVQLAYDYLRSKVSKDGNIGIIGASCGGSQAITLAENSPIKAISFFSSGQRVQNINRYKAVLADQPTLIIAAQEDGGTYTSAQQLFAAAKHGNTKFIAYKGDDHGYPLLDKDKHLSSSIVNWFDSQLE